MSITTQHAEESLCVAHVMAVAGMAGVNLTLGQVFDYGVDGQFDPVIMRGTRRVVSGFGIQFQAKSSINWQEIDNHIVYDLESKTYNDVVSRTDAEATLLLVLLCLPKTQSDWHSVAAGATQLRTCCYWAVLKGDTVKNEKSTKRIKIPTSQILTPKSLTDLLAAERIRRVAQVA